MKLPGINFIKNIKLPGNSNLIRVTILTGIMLLILGAGVFLIFYLMERSETKTARQQDSFARSLRLYDIQLKDLTGTEKEFENLSRDLDKIEKTAIGVESWLSVLKRRRALVRMYPPSIENYRKSINNALKAYPASQPIMAVAAEAIIRNTAINSQAEQTLREWLPGLTDPLFNKLRLGLHVLLGDFRNPQRAQVIPESLTSDGTQTITMNLIILKIIRGDMQHAASDIQTMMYLIPSPDSFRLAGEFYYDFGELERSAEIFSLIDDEKAMSRQADALYLAGYEENAKMIWSLLSDSGNERSLYNLGFTSKNNDEAAGWYKRLVNLDSNSDPDIRQFGLIRYSRLLETTGAISLLQEDQGGSPFVDLEIIRRQTSNWEIGRQIAETWLLLDRHEGDENMYRWAAWLILFQRNYNEIRILLNRTEMLNLDYQWEKIYRSLHLMFDGDIETAEEILSSIPLEEAEWTVHANMGVIMEAQRSTSRALEQYLIAADKIRDPKPAARIQVRIARCYVVLNRPSDAILTLIYALELDPGNLTARLELDRLTY
jgi:tetratricopeptide (TPR) repeat protein